MGNHKKTKAPTAGLAVQPPLKKPRTNPGEVAILSSNVFGLDQATWDNIEKMADAHDIDIIAIQEGAPEAKVKALVGSDWTFIVTQEAPFAKRIGNKKVPPSAEKKNFNVLLKRKSATDITLQERDYTIETSQKFKDIFIGTPAQATSGRVRKPKVDLDEFNKLGVRRPQKFELTMPGHHAVAVYNYHAPQGGGSELGYSGRDAKTGHEILDIEMAEENAPYKMVIGDQNAHPGSMRKHYQNFDILSATSSPTELIHAAIPRGFNAQPIDLGQDGIDFNHKGKTGCSDHPPMAFKVTLPNST